MTDIVTSYLTYKRIGMKLNKKATKGLGQFPRPGAGLGAIIRRAPCQVLTTSRHRALPDRDFVIVLTFQPVIVLGLNGFSFSGTGRLLLFSTVHILIESVKIKAKVH